MNDLWKNNEIQFARLICELEMAGVITENVLDQLEESMDLEIQDLDELLERATKVWDNSKAKV